MNLLIKKIINIINKFNKMETNKDSQDTAESKINLNRKTDGVFKNSSNTDSARQIISNSGSRQIIHHKTKNSCLSADIELIRNNLMEKNFGLTKEKSENNNYPNSINSNNLANSNFNNNLNKQSNKQKISENYLFELLSNQKNKLSDKNFNIQILSQSLNSESGLNKNISAPYSNNKSNINKEKINFVMNLKPEEILKRIFLIKKNGEIGNLIISNKDIEKLLLFLFHSKNENSIILLIEFLKKNFIENPHNIDIFNYVHIDHFDEECNEWKKLYLYHILFSLINNPETTFESDENFINLILTILEIMADNSNCNKEIFEVIFQELSKLFHKSKNGLICPNNPDYLGISKCDNKEKISAFIKKNILILKSLYSKCIYVEKPHNYFYFNGSEGLKIKERHFQDEKFNLKEGFSVLFWIKPDFVNSRELNIENNLINIKCNHNLNIEITLKENQILIRNGNKQERICSHDHEFFSHKNNHMQNNSEWNFIGITFKKKFSKKAFIKFYINNTTNEYSFDNFDFDNEITEIRLFNKFVGCATSFILFEGILDEKQIELIKEDKKGSERFYGFYSENKLSKFLRKINPKHLENSDFEKFDSLILNSNNQNTSSKAYPSNSKLKSNQNIINLNNNLNYETLKEVMSKNLKIFFTPMRKNENILFDLTNNYHATLASFEKLNGGVCGVRHFHNFQKNIFMLGGINNILPILELMWCTDTYKENFVEFMELISQILFEREKNIKDAVEKNFFQMLSIFIEKFDKEIFNSRLLNIFKDLLKHFFSCIGKNNLCKIFLDNILLNVKILLKFEISLQIEIWKTLYQCYVSDPTEINKFMNIKCLSSIVKIYFLLSIIQFFISLNIKFNC